MGQKTIFNLDDWDFPEEATSQDYKTDSVLADEVINEFALEVSLDAMIDEAESSPGGKAQLFINSNFDNGRDLSQEEEAFKKQIADLFELLELEKTADKSAGIRVYQTDSSPSRPWRFH